MTNTLRHELSPLGVRVTLLTVGAVQTNLHSNERPLSACLDKDSYYSPIVEIIEQVTSAKKLHGYGVPSDGVARAIVQNALKRKPKSEFWTGGLVWILWFVKVVGLTGLMESFGAQERGCRKLTEERRNVKSQ